MAKSSTRRVTIYINGKEVEASVKQIRAEMNRLINEQNRMVIGSDEYIAHAKKIKELRQYLKEHAQNIGSAASAWTEMYNKVLLRETFLRFLKRTYRKYPYLCAP